MEACTVDAELVPGGAYGAMCSLDTTQTISRGSCSLVTTQLTGEGNMEASIVNTKCDVAEADCQGKTTLGGYNYQRRETGPIHLS